MKKLYIWLLVGLAATAVSISFESNIWALISMTSLLVTPLFIVTLKLVKRNHEIAETKSKPSLAVIGEQIHGGKIALEHRRREKMRSEANALQAELKRINEIEESYLRIERLAKWKIKSITHHRMYTDFYDQIPDYNDDVKLNIRFSKQNTDSNDEIKD